jgi:diguanylate cyclase (GGDEF)-like protein/PAS domain S-box-containing protein
VTDEEEAAAQELARLRRRLARERAARLEAEQISERVTRDLYDSRAEVQLLETVVRAANEASTIQEALQVAVDSICAHTGWPVGHVYMLDAGAGALVPTAIWHVEDEQRHAPFRAVTENTTFSRGVGLPGRVLASCAPAWISDVRADPNFPRADVARSTGIGAAFAFPILIGADTVGVVEFFSISLAEPDGALLNLMAQIGTQLGRVVERHRGEEERQLLSQQQRAVLEAAGEGIIGFGVDGRTTFVNPAAAVILGRSAEEMIGAEIHGFLHCDGNGTMLHNAESCPMVTRSSASGASKSGEDVFWRGDGTSFPVDYIRTAIRNNGQITGAVLTFNDTTERKRFESQLKYLADHDALTGLFNRRRFEEELARQVAHTQRYGGGAALLLDLDNFKYINDALGHQGGDELIRSVAGLLRGCLRQTDVLARLGGDEFAILLPRVGRERAEEMAIRLVRAVRGHTVVASERPIRVTTSVGVTVLGQAELTAEEVLVEADIAMYEAKEAGRDRYAIYTPEVGSRMRSKAGTPWTERIRNALVDDGFVLYCQPILDLGKGEVSQYELLLRMRGDEDGDVILPGAFLPPAERFGLIRDIDRWVVHEAINVLARLEQQGSDVELLLEINLSGKSVGDPELPKLIAQDLTATGLDPSKLIFEITETAAIANIEDAAKFARGLNQLGCRFALDDFGAGFGSFYYLKYLPLDYLKIDGDFIEKLATSPVDQRMVRAMVEVARGLEMKTIAEYVGDDDSLKLLRSFGVDYAQGFHIGKPAPITTLVPERAI